MDSTSKRIQEVISAQTAEVRDYDEALVGLDSLDRIQFACDLEEEFGVIVVDDRLNQLQTVSKIADYINELLAV
jgi:acyl carrier protein